MLASRGGGKKVESLQKIVFFFTYSCHMLLFLILDRKVCTYVPERRSQAEESSVHQYTFIMISKKERMFPATRNRYQSMYSIILQIL
jgi:hypothetical protein